MHGKVTMSAIHTFADPVALASDLAIAVCDRLNQAIAERGHAILAVSGGTTPKLFFRTLSQTALDWSKVTVELVDERCAPPDSDQLNALLVQDNLVTGKAAAARFRPMFSYDAGTAEDAARRAADALERPADVLVLGMGNDGHTASLFPDGDKLAEGLDSDRTARVIAMRAPHAGVPRLTRTLPEILAAGHLFLHIEGADKRAVLDAALAGDDAMEMPIRAVLHHPGIALDIYWAPKA